MKHENRLVNMAIEVCADSVEELRKCDVERALQTAFANKSYLATKDFIMEQRPDLIPACRAVALYDRKGV